MLLLVNSVSHINEIHTNIYIVYTCSFIHSFGQLERTVTICINILDYNWLLIATKMLWWACSPIFLYNLQYISKNTSVLYTRYANNGKSRVWSASKGNIYKESKGRKSALIWREKNEMWFSKCRFQVVCSLDCIGDKFNFQVKDTQWNFYTHQHSICFSDQLMNKHKIYIKFNIYIVITHIDVICQEAHCRAIDYTDEKYGQYNRHSKGLCNSTYAHRMQALKHEKYALI